MRVLFDHNTPAPLRYALTGCAVETMAERGWQELSNGKLLAAAEQAGFDVFFTADKGCVYQQNVTERALGVVVLSRGNWPDLKVNGPKILEAVRSCVKGQCVFVVCAPRE